MLIQWYKNISYVGTILWVGLGLLTIGSIILSLIGWTINLFMGLLFIFIGCFLYLRAINFFRFYRTVTSDDQNNQHIKIFLRLDLIFILGIGLFGGLLLIASMFRVFGEGYAIFG